MKLFSQKYLHDDKTSTLSTQNEKLAGFTLIELLLVIALLGITVGLTTDILLSLTRSYGKTQILSDVEQSANFATQKLEKELRKATNVSVLSNVAIVRFSDGSCSFYRVQSNELQRLNTANCLVAGTYEGLTKNVSGGVAVACSGSCFTVTGTSPQIFSYSLVFAQPTTVTGINFSAQVISKNTIVIRNTY